MVEVIYVFILLEVKRNRSVRVAFGLGFTLSDSILWCKEKVTCGKVCCEKLSSGGKVCGKKKKKVAVISYIFTLFF